MPTGPGRRRAQSLGAVSAPRAAPARPGMDDGGRLHASYQTRQFTVPAGESVFADVHVRLVALLTLDGADTCLIRLNDGPLGLAFESWQFRTPGDPHGIRRIELINPAGSPITVVLALARSGELVDGRFALPAAIDVDITAQTASPLVVELDADALPVPVELAAQSLSPLVVSHDFTDAIGANTHTAPLGASWYHYRQGGAGGSGIDSVLATGSNTNGAILRTALIIAQSGASTLTADTAAPTGDGSNRRGILTTLGSGVPSILPYPLFLPAGVGLWTIRPTATFYAQMTWDLL
jgi:hypothetical protein